MRDIDAARLAERTAIIYRLLLGLQDEIGDVAAANLSTGESVPSSSFDDTQTRLVAMERDLRVLRDWLQALSHGERKPIEYRKGKLD